MAIDQELPCDSDGVCMLCKKTPPEEEKFLCKTCVTPWHRICLRNPPEKLSSLLEWECPDCSPVTGNPVQVAGNISSPTGKAAAATSGSDLIASIRAIQANSSLTEKDKAKKRQELMTKGARSPDLDEAKTKKESNDVLDLLDESFNCSFCMQLPERPVTTPCGHNFCLKCFQKWIGQGKRNCAKCRTAIPPKMASQPRINSALVVAIRMAKTAKYAPSQETLKVYHFIHNQNRPDKAFTTERAKKAGKANACSGKIFVTMPPDHFGPILAENDPGRNQGVLVGEFWEDRMECRQWGAHLPHVAGIAGQSDYGAQSVALSGGYEDDEDHGEWFLYTGSGGRDLSGNKRTNKEQSFDQKFEKLNEALRVSCKMGYPVRVVRSHKEKRSAYAPETGVRYDGIYRIEKCWRKVGIQGFKVCRYLFIRCDNEPAPWTSDEHGDRPRPLPTIKELKQATDTTERKGSPAWDWDEEKGWIWTMPPPVSKKPVPFDCGGNPDEIRKARRALRQARAMSVRERLLKEFSCQLCQKVMSMPLTTPCAHNFCKACLEGAFAGQKSVRERSIEGGRSLRAQKIIKKCPSCQADISDFLQNPQINRELMDVIESLQRKSEEEEVEESGKEVNDAAVDSSDPVGETETDAGNSKVSEGTCEAPAEPSKALSKYKRKEMDSAGCSATPDGNVGKKSKGSEVEEENGSPSSPLLVKSDGEFE